jgi:phage-related protein
MATFPDIEADFGAVKQSSPAVRIARFGDGYEQRVQFGINQDPKQWRLRWQFITEANSDTIETFLEARAADGAPFSWSPPDDSSTYKWVCDSWTKTLPSAGLATIDATFRQVFEP